MESFIDKEVEIVGDHPHRGEIGKVLRIEHYTGCKTSCLIVEGKGNDFAVYDTNNINIKIKDL